MADTTPTQQFTRMRHSGVWRTDLLYLLAQQGPDALRRSAGLFGFQPPPLAAGPEEEHSTDEAAPAETITGSSGPHAAETRVSPSGQRYPRLLRRDKVPAEERRTEAPSRLAATPTLAPHSEPAAPPLATHPEPSAPPLAPWPRLWPFLRMALGCQSHGSAIDIPRLVAGLALGRSFRRLPRLQRNGWSPTAQVIIDQGLRLYPFWRDFQDLAEGLLRLRGLAGLEVIGFPEGPDRETISWVRGRRGREAPYRLPEPGTPILILSDLGYLDSAPEPWLAFGRRLKAGGFRPVALMPCPPRYWDDELGELFYPVVWDRGQRLPRLLDGCRTRPEAPAPDPGVEQLLRLAAWAVRVEPGLLRALRVRLGSDAADVGSEAAVWRHPDVQDCGLSFVIRPERQEFHRDAAAQELRQRGAGTRALYDEAHALLRAHHAGLHPAILAEEEMLRAQILGVAPAPDALEFMWRTAATLDRPQGYPHLPRLRAWVLRMAERQHQAMWRWEEGEPMTIALAKVLLEQSKDRGGVDFPPGFDANRALWILGEQTPRIHELRLDLTRQGEPKLTLNSPGTAHADVNSGSDDVLAARFAASSARLQWRHVDASGNIGPTHAGDIRHALDIPVPVKGRLEVWSNLEKLEIDAMACPAKAKLEQDRGPGGEYLLRLTFLNHPDRPLLWLPPDEYPILDRTGRETGRFTIPDGRFAGLETWRELREHGFRQPDWAERIGQDEYGLFADFVYKGVTQRFRWIQPGRFWMGSPEDEPERFYDETRHEVFLSAGYWLADTACTQSLWEAVMGKNPSHFKDGKRPVEMVSWNDVKIFLDKLNRLAPGLEARLPTEAEWEYACRAGTETPFCFGDNITPEQVNYNGNSPYAGGKKGLYREKTVPVKELPANGWGLHQMHGNVWEWCADWRDKYPHEVVVDPVGPSQGPLRVLRGGGWLYDGWLCRSASRRGCEPGDRFSILGFRVARGLSPSGQAGSVGVSGVADGGGAPAAAQDSPSLSPRYASLVARVVERVRKILRSPGAGPLARHWSTDPLAGFGKTDPAGELEELLDGLHRATKAVIREWQASPRVQLRDVKADCRELLSELVRLAVNPDIIASTYDITADNFFIASQYAGLAVAIYCSLKDLQFKFVRPRQNLDVETDIEISLFPLGIGKDLRNDVLQTLWRRVIYGEEPPKQIDGEHYKKLVARIQRLEKRDRKRYLLTAHGPPEWCKEGMFYDIAKELRLGVVIRGDGENSHLLMDEDNLIDAIREYLQLLEAWEPHDAKHSS